MSEFSSWLIATRKQKKLSQAQLAERVSASPAQVSQWESGRLEPKADVLKRLIEVLGRPPASSPAVPSKASPSVPPGNGSRSKANGSGAAILGFEQKMWEAADKLRGSMDPGEYKHVVLGLIFLKYISDAFEEKFVELQNEDERRQLLLHLNDNYSCRAGAGWMERHGDQRAVRVGLG